MKACAEADPTADGKSEGSIAGKRHALYMLALLVLQVVVLASVMGVAWKEFTERYNVAGCKVYGT